MDLPYGLAPASPTANHYRWKRSCLELRAVYQQMQDGLIDPFSGLAILNIMLVYEDLRIPALRKIPWPNRKEDWAG